MKFLNKYFNTDAGITVTGLTSELEAIYITHKFNSGNDNVLVLTSTLYEANKVFESLKTYSNDVFLFPMDDFLSSMILAVSPELKIKRLETFEEIKKNKKAIIVTNLMGFLRYLPDKKQIEKLSIPLKKGDSIRRLELESLLDKFGYNKESLVTTTGEYAARGFIIDIFIIQEYHPIRIEFFGNDIESIRYFDESTQKSISEIDSIKILPYKEIETNSRNSLFDYLDNPVVMYIDYNQIRAGYLKLAEEILEYKQKEQSVNQKFMFELEEINISKEVYIENFDDGNKANGEVVRIDSVELKNFNSDLDSLKVFVKNCLKNKKTVVFCLAKENQITKICDLFDDVFMKNEIELNKVNLLKKRIQKGFAIGDYVVIGEYDIEQVKDRAIKYKNTYRVGRKIKGFDDISAGDYVVHLLHGIGIYDGVITLTKNGIKKDYIQINYLGNDKVYIPVEKIDTIYKYSDKDGMKPKINRLGTTAWEKTKLQLRKKINDISGMLIKLYAERSKKEGIVFKDVLEEDIFSTEFPYVLTEDQVKAIRDIDESLKSSVPMDRLLCGDVGFGKTEVAFRAMFKAVMNGYQVLYLCPTTILSSQQYKAAKERFKNHPVNMALLNRFVSAKEQKKVINDIKSGNVDIVFGTHRLLSEDIEPKKMGLLVVDEEQRFGVTHKEKIKKFKSNINVLTLSATPIPRTLKMSMAGLRDLSIIDTAPAERYPVQTYVLAENDLLIKDSIYKELSRGGQVFILYNRVESIEDKVAHIQKLVPDARILSAHGQMSKTELEYVMQNFVDGEADILVCTTIIETGIDIANVNTLIIYDADRFGLSQLYQIRGRVGRSNKIAYAYLLYNPKKILNEIAMKRLQAIKEFTELGSGYKVAMRDLAIRGAGDILGSEQAGFVSSVGIELYMKMIEEEILHQNGQEVEKEEASNTQSLINVETHISDEYVSEESIKIDIHQKVNEIDSYESFKEIKHELEDRFGKIPEALLVYMYEEWFEKLAKKLNITKVTQNNHMIEIELPEKLSSNVKVDKLFLQSQNINPKFTFKYVRKKIIIALNIVKQEKHFIYYLVPLLNVIEEQRLGG